MPSETGDPTGNEPKFFEAVEIRRTARGNNNNLHMHCPLKAKSLGWFLLSMQISFPSRSKQGGVEVRLAAPKVHI